MHIMAVGGLQMQTENDIAAIIVLLAPVGLIYSWHFYFTKIRAERASWPDRLTLLSLTLASSAALLWPIAMIFAPKENWTSYAGVPQQIEFIESWERVSVRTLLVAFLLCFLGRPLLIAPIAVACVGTMLFWVFSTMF
jgi:hypothetical protein